MWYLFISEFIYFANYLCKIIFRIFKQFAEYTFLWFSFLILIFFIETPVFPLGIAALRRRNPGEKMVAGSIPHKGHFWELLNRLLNFWYWSDEFEKQTRTRKVTSTVRSYPYPVHRTPTDDPIYGGRNGPRWR